MSLLLDVVNTVHVPTATHLYDADFMYHSPVKQSLATLV